MRPPDDLPSASEVCSAQRTAVLGVGVATTVGATVAALTVLLAGTSDVDLLALPAAMLTLIGFLLASQRPGRVAALARRELAVAGSRRGRLRLGWSTLRRRPQVPNDQDLRDRWAVVASARLSLAVPVTTLVALAMGLAALQSVLRSGVLLSQALALIGVGGLLCLLIGQVALLRALRRGGE